MAPRRSRYLPRILASLLAGAVTVAAAPQVHASDEEDLLIGLGVTALVVGELTFSIRDIVAVAKDEHPGMAWSVSESIFGGIQTIGFGVGTTILAASDEEDESVIGTIIIAPLMAWVSTLTAHGVWGAIDGGADPGGLFGVSPLIGGNTTLTLIAVANAGAGRLPSLGPAVIETVGAVPGTVVGAYETAKDKDDRPLWIGLTAWSGTLFLHGLISSIAYGAGYDPYYDDYDSPPVPPDVYAPEPPERPPPDMIQAAKVVVTPATMIDIRGQQAPAITISGQLY